MLIERSQRLATHSIGSGVPEGVQGVQISEKLSILVFSQRPSGGQGGCVQLPKPSEGLLGAENHHVWFWAKNWK